MSNKVVVLSKAEGFCPACKQTSKLLDTLGVDYQEIKVTAESPEFIKVFEMTGVRNMPIVLPNGLDDSTGFFSGFQPNELKKLAIQ